MQPLAGPLFAAALLAAVAGAIKVARPAGAVAAIRDAGLPAAAPAVRALGAAELGVALVALGRGDAWGPLALGAMYAAFAGFAILASRRASGSCGCFGAASAPVGRIHVIANSAVVALAVAAAWRPPGSLAAVLADQPGAGVPFLALTGLVAALLYLTLTAAPRLAAARPA